MRTLSFRGRVVMCGALAVAACATSLAGASGGDVGPGAETGVVELFTSQGCPKCPAADRLITDLAHRPGTIALSFPVTTWDYIGWKDTLASSAFATRQRDYAAARGDDLVFTPQAVIDGVGVAPGADRSAILNDIDAFRAERRAMDVGMHLSESNGRLHVAIDAMRSGPQAARRPAEVYVLRVARTKTVAIARGDNSGRSVTYTNVVRAIGRVGKWNGEATDFDVLELKGDDEGYVVLLQAGPPNRPGPILAAAKTADL